MPWPDIDPFDRDAPQAPTLPTPGPLDVPPPVATNAGGGRDLLKMLLIAAPALMLGAHKGGVGAAGAGLSGLTRGYLARQQWDAQRVAGDQALEQRAEALRIQRARVQQQFVDDLMTRLEQAPDAESAKQLLEFAETHYQALGGQPGTLRNLPLPKSRGLEQWKKVTRDMLSAFEKAQGPEALAQAVAGGWTMARPDTEEQVKVGDLIEWANYGMRDAAGKPVFLPPPPKPAPTPTPNETERYLGMSPEDQAKYRQARKEIFQADDYPRVPKVNVTTGPLMAPEDIEEIADAIVSGDQPPDTKGLFRYGGPLRAALARRKYPLTRANLDWEATKRFFASANSTQQIRLKQAADTAFHSLDIIDALSEEWQAGGFPVLNRARLAAAKNGLLGQRAASIATRLEAQINDLVSELGNVYMGGNSPTDHSLQIAAKNLSSDWSETVLRDAVELARANLRIRINALKNVSAVTPSTVESPEPLVKGMTPAAAPAGGRVQKYNLVNGRLVKQ